MDYNEAMDLKVSYEMIYNYIYFLPKGTLKQKLMIGFERNRKRINNHRLGGRKERTLKEMAMIDEHPEEIEFREIQAISIVHANGEENKIWLIGKLERQEGRENIRKVARKFKRLASHARLTMTYDLGREMAEHLRLTKESKMKVYFTHKGCTWQRGSNENLNGHDIQFFTKGTDFNKQSDYEI